MVVDIGPLLMQDAKLISVERVKLQDWEDVGLIIDDCVGKGKYW